MITLNAEKGLVRIEEWSEILERPGFIQSLDPSRHKLKEIIGRYVSKDRVNCGLSNCHTPHSKGYLVSTTDGYETNIGKDCGKREFGVDFERRSKEFDARILEKENREKLWSFRFQSDSYEEKLEKLKSGPAGATEIRRKLQCLLNFERGVPSGVVEIFRRMVRERKSTLTTEREATRQELDDIEVMTGKRPSEPHYIEEQVAEISGIPALFPENSLREILVRHVEEPIEMVKGLDIDSLSRKELKYWAKSIASIDQELENAERVLSQAKRLLKPNNLRPFIEVLDDPNERKELREFLAGLDERSPV